MASDVLRTNDQREGTTTRVVNIMVIPVSYNNWESISGMLPVLDSAYAATGH